MKLRFEVNQAELFRSGIDCPKSRVTVEVDPATLDQQIRDLIADRMVGGIDVCKMDSIMAGGKDQIIASEATLEALIDAVRGDDAKVDERN